MVFITEADFLGLFQFIFLSSSFLIPYSWSIFPFNNLSYSIFHLLYPYLSSSENLRTCSFSCLLQHDNSLQFCLCSDSHSVIFPYNLCSAPTQMVPFSTAHFHPVTEAKLNHCWPTDQICRCWTALTGLEFHQAMASCCTHHPTPRILAANQRCWTLYMLSGSPQAIWNSLFCTKLFQNK